MITLSWQVKLSQPAWLPWGEPASNWTQRFTYSDLKRNQSLLPAGIATLLWRTGQSQVQSSDHSSSVVHRNGDWMFWFSMLWSNATLQFVWAPQVVQWSRTCLPVPEMQETRVPSPGWEDPLEEEVAPRSSMRPWEIPRTEEPGRLQSRRLQKVGCDWVPQTHTL